MGTDPELVARIMRLFNEPDPRARLPRVNLEDRILAVLAGGERLRPGVIADRVGVPVERANPGPLLRLLPGQELFGALARLVDAGRLSTDASAEFYLPTRKPVVDPKTPNRACG